MVIIRSPYTPYFIYLQGTVGVSRDSGLGSFASEAGVDPTGLSSARGARLHFPSRAPESRSSLQA